MVFLAAVALAGYQFAEHWQRLVDTNGLGGLSHDGLWVAGHAVLAMAAAYFGYVLGQTLRLNHFASKKLLSGFRVFGTRGRSRPGWDGATSLRTAYALEMTLEDLPAGTVLHGLKVMNGDTAIILDHAFLYCRTIVLMRGALPGADDYTLSDSVGEMSLAAQVIQRDTKRRIKVSAVNLVPDGKTVRVHSPGVGSDLALTEWLTGHFAGAPTQVDRVVFREMVGHLLP